MTLMQHEWNRFYVEIIADITTRN